MPIEHNLSNYSIALGLVPITMSSVLDPDLVDDLATASTTVLSALADAETSVDRDDWAISCARQRELVARDKQDTEFAAVVDRRHGKEGRKVTG